MSSELVKSNSGVSQLSITPEKFVQAAVASEMFKDTKSVAQAYIKLTIGAALGIDPATSMSSIIIINGRPSFTANLIAARIKQSGKYRFEVIEKTDKKCSLQFYERIDDYTEDGKPIKKWVKPGPVETFTIEMAKSSGVDRNPVWKTFPMNLCFCRALTNGAKTYCPDVMVGNQIYTPDELDPKMKMKVEDGEVVPDAEYTEEKATPKAEATDALKEIESLIESQKVDRAKFLEYFQVDSVTKLTAEDKVKAMKLLREKQKAAMGK